MTKTILAAAAALAIFAPAAVALAEGVHTGDRAAELVNVADLKGRSVKLRSHRGKVVVMTFGASWCKPCRKELPAYDRLAKQYKDAGKSVVFLAVNIDTVRANAEKFIKETRVASMLVGLDPQGATADVYGPETMPTTYVIDARGVVRHVQAGYENGDEKKIGHKVDELLAK